MPAPARTNSFLKGQPLKKSPKNRMFHHFYYFSALFGNLGALGRTIAATKASSDSNLPTALLNPTCIENAILGGIEEVPGIGRRYGPT